MILFFFINDFNRRHSKWDEYPRILLFFISYSFSQLYTFLKSYSYIAHSDNDTTNLDHSQLPYFSSRIEKVNIIQSFLFKFVVLYEAGLTIKTNPINKNRECRSVLRRFLQPNLQLSCRKQETVSVPGFVIKLLGLVNCLRARVSPSRERLLQRSNKSRKKIRLKARWHRVIAKYDLVV